MFSEVEWLRLAACRSDPIAGTLVDRAEREWCAPLAQCRWELPPYLVFDLGVLLLRPTAQIDPSATGPSGYAEALIRTSDHEYFRLCSQIIGRCRRDLQDGAIRVAIEAVTRQVRAALAQAKVGRDGWYTPEVVQLIGESLAGAIAAKEGYLWLSPIDLIAIRAAAETKDGHRLLDYELLDRCLESTEALPELRLRWRRVPTRVVGPKHISRQMGEVIGYTSFRSRLPGDELHEILPSEWALFRENEIAGLDKLLNRQALIYRRETPHDLIPKLRILVAFIVDAAVKASANSLQTLLQLLQLRELPPDPQREGKALVFRMIQDLVRQVPAENLEVEIGLYVRDFEQGRSLLASCFDLRELEKTAGRFDELLQFNNLVPRYFYPTHFASEPEHQSALSSRGLSDDPYVHLNTAAAATGTYAGTFAVMISCPGRWPAILPHSRVVVRAPEAARPGLLVVEVRGSRSFALATFHDFLQVHGLSSHRLTPATETNVRTTFLSMVFGPHSLGTEMPLVAPPAET